MDKWLGKIGLKGRKLQSAVQSCEDNFIDDLDELRQLEKDRLEYEKTFPQSIVRSTISKALASEEHAQIRKSETRQSRIKTQEQAAQKRY